MYYTDNHALQMLLAARRITPIKESGRTAYYIKTEALKDAVSSFYCRYYFNRGGKWEND